MTIPGFFETKKKGKVRLAKDLIHYAGKDKRKG